MFPLVTSKLFFLILLNSILCSLVNSLRRINSFHPSYKILCMFVHIIYTHTHERPSQNKLKSISLIKSHNNFKLSGIKNKGISSMIKAEFRKHISNLIPEGLCWKLQSQFSGNCPWFGTCLPVGRQRLFFVVLIEATSPWVVPSFSQLQSP